MWSYMCHQRDTHTETERQTESVVTNGRFLSDESSSQYERQASLVQHWEPVSDFFFFFKCSDFSLKIRTLGQLTEILAVYFLRELCSVERCAVSFFLPFINVDSYPLYFLNPKVETCLPRKIKDALDNTGCDSIYLIRQLKTGCWNRGVFEMAKPVRPHANV